MKVKYLYVITSDQDDLFFEQLHVSLFSLRYRMPKAHITILSDKKTDEEKHFNTSSISHYIDELVLIDLGDDINKKIRSRYLKTNMRNYVDGDFLFIDSDTVVIETFDCNQDFDSDLMAVPDGHVLLENHYIKRFFIEQLKPFNVSHSGKYWNSGVLFVKDNLKTRKFFQKWHENYKISLSLGNSQDQAAFFATDQEFKLVSELPAKYNVQILFGLHYLEGAKIIHYFSSNKKFFMKIASDEFLKSIRDNGISQEAAQLILNPKSSFVENSGILFGEDLYSYYSADNNEYSIYKTNKFTIGNKTALEFYKRVECSGIAKLFAYINIVLLKFEITLCNIKVMILKNK